MWIVIKKSPMLAHIVTHINAYLTKYVYLLNQFI